MIKARSRYLNKPGRVSLPGFAGLGHVGAPGVDFWQEMRHGIGEFGLPLKFFGVAGAWVVGDLALHQAFPHTAGPRTPINYYGAKLLWGVPALIAGRVLSDYIGGSKYLRAAVIAGTASALIQIRYLKTATLKYNLTIFGIHFGLLYPLSFLIVGEPGEELIPWTREGARGASR